MVQQILGVSLKKSHLEAILANPQPIDFFEFHAENYFSSSPSQHHGLTAIAKDYDLSMHGVGLSLGGADILDQDHLKSLKLLIDRYQPKYLSEHLAWSRDKNHYYNDLFPFPYHQVTLDHLESRLDFVQNYLGRSMMIENPARYQAFSESTMDEADFLNELCERSGCSLLLDLTNLYISGHNLNFNPFDYLAKLNLNNVGEIHLAGIEQRQHMDIESKDGVMLIDSHAFPLELAILPLYQHIMMERLQSNQAIPSLIEWDNLLPDWQGFLNETHKLRQWFDTIEQPASHKRGFHA